MTSQSSVSPEAWPDPEAGHGREPERGLDIGLGSWPERRARMSPDRVALTFNQTSVTYAQLADRVARLAQVLTDFGVRAGDRIAYLGPNHPAFLEALFAAARVGCIFVPLNTRLAPAELQYMLDDTAASLLIWSSDHAATVAALRHADVTPGRSRALLQVGPTLGDDSYERAITGASPATRSTRAASLDDVCMIMYTSGTTGTPKGAMLTHGNLTWNCYNLLLDLDLTGHEVALVSAPLFHTAALNHTALPVFLKGGTSILASKFDVDGSYDLIATHQVTLMFGVPTMFEQISASPRWHTADLKSLRTLHCGGAPVPTTLIQRYQGRGLTFIQGYGMTEASPGALLLRAEQSVHKVGSAGTPLFFTDVHVVRPDMSDTLPGEPGEIVLRGPNVMAGYWRRPEATHEAINGGWLHTGDVAKVDDEGYVYIVDRIKDMIISGGENIYPAEVENALQGHPAVQECAVIGVADLQWGEVGRAVIVARPGMSVEADDILSFLATRVAKYKIPKSIVFVDALPRNGAGKLLRATIKSNHAPEPKLGDPPAIPAQTPRTEDDR